MPGGRPDPDRIRANAQTVFAGAGETATLKTFVGTSGGNPRFGIGDAYNYAPTTITALFYARKKLMLGAVEEQRFGGQVITDTLYISTNYPIQARDQVIWRGTAYRVEGVPQPQNFGGRVQWHSPLTLAAPTG